MPTFYGAIDLSKNELRNAVVQNLGSAPSSPLNGQLWYDSANQILKWWNGSAWISAMSGSSLTPASTVTTEAIGSTPIVGASVNYAREDHLHGMPNFSGSAPPAETTYGLAVNVGSAATVARSDHTHGSPSLTGNAPTTAAIGDVATLGAGTLPSKDDHRHGMPVFAAPTAETAFGTSSAAGSATSLPRSDHTHGNPTHLAADHSTIPISAFATATAAINMGNFNINNVLDPTTAQQAATKNYVDNAIAGLSWKAPARAASTANIAALTGTMTVDGVALIANDRILVKNQTTASQNGIYVVAAGAWARSTDADAAAEVLNMAAYIQEGTTQADTAWVCTTNAPITINSTNLTFVQFSGGGTYTAGSGLSLTGNVFAAVAGTGITVGAAINVDTTVIATQAFVTGGYQPLDSDLTALASNATNGLWSRTGTGTGAARTFAGTLPISVANPDGVAGNPTISIATFAGSAIGAVPASAGGTTNFLRADGTWSAPPGGTVRSYAAALAGTASPEVVTHNLNTQDVIVMVHSSNTPYAMIQVDWQATSVNTVSILYNPTLGAGYRVVVMG